MNVYAWKRGRVIPLALLVLLGIAIGATLLSIGDSGASSPAQAGAGGGTAEAAKADAAPIKEVELGQRQAFAVLRGPSEELPGTIRAMLSAPGAGRGFNFDFAQKATPAGSESPVWVIPGRDWICIFVQLEHSGGLSCDTTAGAASDGIDLAVAGPSKDGEPSQIESTVGLVPDGVQAVRFAGNEGGPEVESPHQNVYYVDGGSSGRPSLIR